MTIPYNIVVEKIHALWVLFTPTVSSGSSERSFLFYKPLTPINIIRPADKIFGDTEPLGQLPDFGVAFRYGHLHFRWV